MGMSIKSSSAGMTQATSSVSNMQQQMLLKSIASSAPSAPAAAPTPAPANRPVGSVGHNINVTA
jgi:hypothetical protein